MKQNPARKALSERLHESELQYDINRMITERDYHISQGYIFEEAIKERKQELQQIHEAVPDEEMYK
jgi:hypothetical protein